MTFKFPTQSCYPFRKKEALKNPLDDCRQVPQYSFVGASEVFTYIGQLEFFYEQSPEGIRGLGSALALTTFGLGNYLSSILVTAVTRITSSGGGSVWIPEKNLNRGHLDYFYWFLAALSTLNLFLYVKCAQWYRITSAQLTIPSGTCMSPTGCIEHKSFTDHECHHECGRSQCEQFDHIDDTLDHVG